MKIEAKKYVSIHYTLTLDDGEQVDSSEGGKPLGFVHGFGQIIPGLEKALEGAGEGDKMKVEVSPEDGYGVVNDEMHRDLPRENFPEDVTLEAGMGFTAQGPHGPVSFTVIEAKDDVVVCDFNHPLAGKTRTFDVEVAEVREVTEEELALLTGQMAGGCSPDDCASKGCDPSGCGGGAPPTGGCGC